MSRCPACGGTVGLDHGIGLVEPADLTAGDQIAATEIASGRCSSCGYTDHPESPFRPCPPPTEGWTYTIHSCYPDPETGELVTTPPRRMRIENGQAVELEEAG